MTGESTFSETPSVLVELDKLALPAGSFMVMGSGILDALGIRPAHDVDMVVSDEIYEKLSAEGWGKKVASDGHQGIEQGVIEAYRDWTDDDGVVKDLSEILVDAEWIDGVAYNSLAKLVRYKTRRGLAKDFADLVLINEYLEGKK